MWDDWVYIIIALCSSVINIQATPRKSAVHHTVGNSEGSYGLHYCLQSDIQTCLLFRLPSNETLCQYNQISRSIMTTCFTTSQCSDIEEDQMEAIQHCEECLTFASPFHLTEEMQTAILCKGRNANNVLTLVFITDQQDRHGTEQMLEGCGSC